MKKTYKSPVAEIIRIATVSMLAGSAKVGLDSSKGTSSEGDLLGHDDDFDW